MSSTPYRLGMEVFTTFGRKMPADFVIEDKTEKDCYKTIRAYARTLPDTVELLCYSIGMRPDKDVPVARFFVEVHERVREPRMIQWAWTAIIRGGRKT